MSSIEDYVQIMIDSLEKKSVLLERIQSRNEIQANCLKKSNFEEIDWDSFNTAMVEKEAEIDRINEMDEGFQILYERVSRQLKDNRDQYSLQIKKMQGLIKNLEEKSIQIRAFEERNRAKIEQVMLERKKEIRQARTSLKVASSYYQSMLKAVNIDASMLDNKK